MILTVRPEPGASATVAAGKMMGLTIESCPLSALRSLDWTPPRGPFDGLLLGSANAIRHGAPLVDKLVDKPVYAVGEATAAAARERGFTVARTGRGDLQELLGALTGERLRLLRIAGAERTRVDPPPGITVATVTAYDSSPLPLTPEVALRLSGSLVLLHSAAAARHFAAECDRLDVQRRAIRLVALSRRIAEAAGVGWANVRVAAEANEGALLALARDMCHGPPSR
jgi:uroporphyrinogen-III synthase